MTSPPIVPRAAWIALVVVTIGGHVWPASPWWALAECAVAAWMVYRILGRIAALDRSAGDPSTKSTDKTVDHLD